MHVPEVSDVRGRVHDDDLISGHCDDALQQPAAISQSMAASFPVTVTMPFRLQRIIKNIRVKTKFFHIKKSMRSGTN